MDEQMLEQIQQMITAATVSLRREIVGDLRQEMTGIATGLDQKMTGLAGELRQEMGAMESRLGERIDEIGLAQRATESRLSERIEGIELAQQATESRLGERIDETKRHSGVLVEGLRHELQLVAEGIQMHIERRHREDRDHLDHQFQEHRVLMQTSYSQLNNRMDRHEQSHHN